MDVIRTTNAIFAISGGRDSGVHPQVLDEERYPSEYGAGERTAAAKGLRVHKGAGHRKFYTRSGQQSQEARATGFDMRNGHRCSQHAWYHTRDCAGQHRRYSHRRCYNTSGDL